MFHKKCGIGEFIALVQLNRLRLLKVLFQLKAYYFMISGLYACMHTCWVKKSTCISLTICQQLYIDAGV